MRTVVTDTSISSKNVDNIKMDNDVDRKGNQKTTTGF